MILSWHLFLSDQRFVETSLFSLDYVHQTSYTQTSWAHIFVFAVSMRIVVQHEHNGYGQVWIQVGYSVQTTKGMIWVT